jgi:hypothetical protein
LLKLVIGIDAADKYRPGITKVKKINRSGWICIVPPRALALQGTEAGTWTVTINGADIYEVSQAFIEGG